MATRQKSRYSFFLTLSLFFRSRFILLFIVELLWGKGKRKERDKLRVRMGQDSTGQASYDWVFLFLLLTISRYIASRHLLFIFSYRCNSDDKHLGVYILFDVCESVLSTLLHYLC